MPDVQENNIWKNVIKALQNAGTGFSNFIWGPTHDPETGVPLDLDGRPVGPSGDMDPGVRQRQEEQFRNFGESSNSFLKDYFLLAGEPQLPKIPKELPKMIKGTRKGVLDFEERNLGNQGSGMRAFFDPSNFLDNFIAENTPRGDAIPIDKKGWPIPYGPSQFPRA